MLAALINACRLTGRRMEDLEVLMVGAGAAGVAVAKILMDAGVTVDRRLRPLRRDPHRPRRLRGRLDERAQDAGSPRTPTRAAATARPREVLEGTDLFIGLSGPGHHHRRRPRAG